LSADETVDGGAREHERELIEQGFALLIHADTP
jgi:hypothetical protein